MDDNKYLQLLTTVMPKVIRTPQENAVVLDKIEMMISQDHDLSEEEEAIIDLLTALVDQFEDTYNEYADYESPNEVLEALMFQRGTNVDDLVQVFGSDVAVSTVLCGEQDINRAQAKALGQFFDVDPSIFYFYY